MATGDVLSVTIPDKTTATLSTDGWYCDVILEGMNAEGIYDFGLGENNDTTNAKFIMTVTSEGYTSSGTLSTITRKVYGTRVLRKAYPDEATMWETEADGNVTLRIALSDYVYADDKNDGAGTSGTDPVVSISAGWYNDGSNDNNACTNVTVTNNSTITYPNVIARWDNLAGAMTADRITENFKLAALAFHKFGISCVKFSAVGQTSSNEESSIITTKQSEAYTTTELSREFYRTTDISINSFTEDESIDCNFIAYPIVGDDACVIDTSENTTVVEESIGKNQATIILDVDDSQLLYAYVDTTGSDITGVVSTTAVTAAASPFATISKAIDSNANIVYLNAGTHNFNKGSSSTVKTNSFWTKVLPSPDASKETVTVQFDTATTGAYFYSSRLMLYNVTLKAASGDFWGRGFSSFLRINNCTFDNTGAGLNLTQLGYNCACDYYQECDNLGDGWKTDKYGNDSVRVYEGVELVSYLRLAGTVSAIGLKATEGCQFYFASSLLSSMANRMINGCEVLRQTSTGAILYASAASMASVLEDYAFIGNVFECDDTAGTNPIIEFSTEFADTTNVLFWHNIVFGQRCNMAYTTASDTSLTHEGWSLIGNLLEQYNTKTDNFTGIVNGEANGNWAIRNHVGCYGNIYCAGATDDWLPRFLGLYGKSKVFPAFVDNASHEYVSGTGGDSSGGGDYRIGTDGVQIGLIPTPYIPLTFDLDGNLRSTTLTAAGAYRDSSEIIINNNDNSFEDYDNSTPQEKNNFQDGYFPIGTNRISASKSAEIRQDNALLPNISI